MNLRNRTIIFTLCCLPMTGLATSETLSLPFQETFESGIGSGWTKDASTGAEVLAKDSGLLIRAPQNHFAHVERSLNVDFLRATSEIKPGSGITWCTSLFLYWNPGNWCQMGVSEQNGGAYYVAEMIDGKFIERQVGKPSMTDWNHVGIELAADCIRYLSSSDGANWKTESIVVRPEQYRQAPTLLILGKGHGGPAGYPAADLDNNYASAGPESTSQIRNVAVTQLDWSRLKETAEERDKRLEIMRDPSGTKELARAEDPSFETVSSYFPPLKFSREVLGVKDHPDDIGFQYDGAVQLNYAIYDPKEAITYFEIGDPAYRFGSGSKHPEKSLHEGWMPIVTATDHHNGRELKVTAFGMSRDMSTSEPLTAVIELALNDDKPRTAPLPVRFVLQDHGTTKTLKEWQLPPDQNSVCVRIGRHFDKHPAQEISSQEYASLLSSVADSWNKLIAPSSIFTIPEKRVQDGYRAWQAYNYLNIKTRKGVREICDGSGFYNIIYGYSAVLYCHVLDLLGLHKEAREYLEEMLPLQQPDGLWYVNFGHTDTGTMLTVLAEHYRLSNDGAWLKKVSPRMMAMCEWAIRNRKESMRAVHGRRNPVHGLIRFRPYCDYEAPAYDFYSNSYICAGMEKTAQVFGEIGMTTESAYLAKEAAEYRKDILASMDQAVVTKDGMRMLALMPETQFLLKESNYTANGYYGLNAALVLENGFLPPRDPRAQLIVDMLQQRGGLQAGVCSFFNQIDHAYTYGYWLNSLQRGEVKRAILGLYGSMAYGMSTGTYAAVECTFIATGDNAHTLPHTYSNTKQIRLLRNLILREEGDELLIGQAAPRPWLAAGKVLAAKSAPTEFGETSFQFEGAADGKSVAVSVTPPQRRKPKNLRITLRHPGMGEIKSVEGAGFEHTVEGDTVVIPAPDKPIEFVAKF